MRGEENGGSHVQERGKVMFYVKHEEEGHLEEADRELGQYVGEEVYRSLWRMGPAKEERVCVIGHRNPDPDSVGAAMALSFLLQRLGILAEPFSAGRVSAETAFALRFLGLSAPRVLEKASREAYYLVDHSSYAQAISGMKEGQVVGILDHHALGDVVALRGCKVTCAPVGASCSLVYLGFKQCHLPIPEAMARAMLMGILSDTRNFSRNVEPLDQVAAGELLSLSGLSDLQLQELYRGMAKASASYEGMSDAEVFASRYKVYSLGKIKVGIGDVNVLGERELLPMAKRMEKVMREVRSSLPVDILFTMVTDKEEVQGEREEFQGEEFRGEEKNREQFPGEMEKREEFRDEEKTWESLCPRMGMVPDEEQTWRLLKEAFPQAIEREGVLWFPHSLSRKTGVLPALLKIIR